MKKFALFILVVVLAQACKTYDIYEAAGSGRVDELRKMLAAGQDVNSRDYKGRTPLIVAASRQYPESVQFLISAKADVNAKDNKGETALMKAARMCETSSFPQPSDEGVRIMFMLIEAKADLNAKDKNGDTALMKAAEQDKKGCAQALFHGNVDVNATNNSGQTALHIAESRHASDVINLLRKMTDRESRRKEQIRQQQMLEEQMRIEHEREKQEEEKANGKSKGKR